MTYERFGEEWVEKECIGKDDQDSSDNQDSSDDWYDDECEQSCGYYECKEGDYCLVENCAAGCDNEATCYRYVQTGDNWEAFYCFADEWQSEECWSKECGAESFDSCEVKLCAFGDSIASCVLTLGQ